MPLDRTLEVQRMVYPALRQNIPDLLFAPRRGEPTCGPPHHCTLPPYPMHSCPPDFGYSHRHFPARASLSVEIHRKKSREGSSASCATVRSVIHPTFLTISLAYSLQFPRQILPNDNVPCRDIPLRKRDATRYLHFDPPCSRAPVRLEAKTRIRLNCSTLKSPIKSVLGTLQ